MPTSVEPVNAILSTPGCATSAAPVRPSPVTMLTTPGGSSAWRSTSQNSSAVSGVVSAGLSTTVLPGRERRRDLPRQHQQREVPRDDLARDADRPRAPVRERVLELVGPARVVEEVRGGERQVDVARLLDRLAAVERLEHRELARALLQQPRDPEQVLRALGRAQADQPSSNAPRAAATAASTSSALACPTSASGSSVGGRDRRVRLGRRRATRRRRTGRRRPRAARSRATRARARSRSRAKVGRARSVTREVLRVLVAAGLLRRGSASARR